MANGMLLARSKLSRGMAPPRRNSEDGSSIGRYAMTAAVGIIAVAGAVLQVRQNLDALQRQQPPGDLPALFAQQMSGGGTNETPDDEESEDGSEEDTSNLNGYSVERLETAQKRCNDKVVDLIKAGKMDEAQPYLTTAQKIDKILEHRRRFCQVVQSGQYQLYNNLAVNGTQLDSDLVASLDPSSRHVMASRVFGAGLTAVANAGRSQSTKRKSPPKLSQDRAQRPKRENPSRGHPSPSQSNPAPSASVPKSDAAGSSGKKRVELVPYDHPALLDKAALELGTCIFDKEGREYYVAHNDDTYASVAQNLSHKYKGIKESELAREIYNLNKIRKGYRQQFFLARFEPETLLVLPPHSWPCYSEDEDDDETYCDHDDIKCDKCKSPDTDAKNDMLICDNDCGAGRHFKCCKEKYNKAPAGLWFCSEECECTYHQNHNVSNPQSDSQEPAVEV